MQKDNLRTPIRIVQSRQNSRVKELRAAFHHSGKSEDGRVAIEGFHLVEEALRSNLRLTTLFFTESQESLIRNLDLDPDTELLAVPAEILSPALATETPQPIAAFVEAPVFEWSDLLRPQALIAIAGGLQDPGNLGTIIRSAEAFGATGLICLPGTVNPWNPKALRASSGSAFRLPLLSVSEEECFQRLREHGTQIVAATVENGQRLEEPDWSRATAILIGNEGKGLSKSQIEASDVRVTIPCPGPVESLNAAIAASILLYAVSSTRSHAMTAGERHG